MKPHFISLIMLVLITCIACTKTYVIKPKDFGGIELQGRRGTYKMTISVIAKSHCPATIDVHTNFQGDYSFSFNEKIDTSVSSDWYGEPMKLKVLSDTCVIEDPKITVRFYD